MPGNAKVHILVPDGKEITMGCKQCRHVISTSKDKFMIGLEVEEAGKTFKYFLGVDPPIKCCGEEKLIIKTFDTDAEAEAERVQIRQHLNTHHSTQGLRLIGFRQYGLN